MQSQALDPPGTSVFSIVKQSWGQGVAYPVVTGTNETAFMLAG